MTEKGGGLVKKLLFPGFTDAGSNDTFRASSSMEDIQSDATTAVYDNRTLSKHEVQYDGDRVGGYAPSASAVVLARAAMHSSNNNNGVTQNTDPSSQQQQQREAENAAAGDVATDRVGEPSASRTARLFPSTDPSSSAVSLDSAVGPASAPPMVRRAPPYRTSSTRAFTGSSLLSPRTMPFPSTSPRIRPVEPLVDMQEKQTTDKAEVDTQETHQSSLQHQSEDNSVEAEKTSEKTDENSLKTEHRQAEIDGSLELSRSPPSEQNNLDQSSMALTAASSGAVSSVLGYHFLDQTNNEQECGDEGSTPIMSNVTKNDSSSMESNDENNTQPLTLETLMEMESHQENKNADVSSDVNSNISEYGTVIEAPGRLAEVQAMADLIESRESTEEVQKGPLTEEVQKGPLTPMTETEEEPHNESSVQSFECAEDELESVALASDVAGLALPTLDAKSRDDVPKPLLIKSPKRSRKKSEHRSRPRRTEFMYESFPEKESSPPNTSASAMVTAAIRRIGSGVGNLALSQPLKSPIPTPTPGTLAPPSTPRPNYTRSRSGESFPSSFMLRSPGSSARVMSERPSVYGQNPDPLLSPRYRSFASSQKQQPSTLRHASSLASPLRFARGCFSFDTSMDDCRSMEEYRFPEPIPENQPPQSPSSVGQERTSIHTSTRSRCKSWDVGSSVLASPGQEGPFSSEEYRTFRIGSNQKDSTASAFRSVPTVGDGSRVLHGPPRPAREMETAPEISTPNRGTRMNGFSPAIGNTRDAVALRTPNRIEIEREDAIDILACLVERSAEFDRENGERTLEYSITNATIGDGDDVATIESTEASEDESDTDEKTDTEVDRSSTLAESGGQIDSPPSLQSRKLLEAQEVGSMNSESGFSDLTEAVRLIRDISEKHDGNGADTQAMNHEARMKAIDELLRSYTYAAEMKQATTSASAWLRSIGRDEMAEEENTASPVANGMANGSSVASREQLERDDSTTSGEELDLVAVKAMLHAAETKAQEKEEAVKRLNEELSLCRAEIGRLKSSSRAEHLFTSPNRSILDDNDDDSTTSSEDISKVGADVGALEQIVDDASPILEASGEPSEGYHSFEASFLQSETAEDSAVQEEKANWEALAQAKREIVMLKASLGQANDVIRKLHTESTDGTQSNGEEQREKLDDLIVNIENPEVGKELDEYKTALKKAYEFQGSVEKQEQSRSSTELSATDTAASSPDKRTINVRMLDGENFVTEWDELAPPLPPPPDHGLRSPIVKDLLEQWTSDKSMHESLLSWMGRILDGSDPRSVPPLTISSLNHQTRDGFTMHVLPLLLRRSDVHVEVKMRAHRTTTYDMAVTVSSSVPRNAAGNGDDLSQASSNSNAHQRTTKKHMMAYKASQGDNPVVEESMEVDEGRHPNAAGRVSDYLLGGSFSRSSEHGSDSVAHSAITTQITNSSRTRAADGRMPPRPVPAATRAHETPIDSDSDHYVSHGSRSLMMGDELSVGSSISRSSSQRSSKEQQSGLMSTIGGALGLLSRRKAPSTPQSPWLSASHDDDSWNDSGSSKAARSPRGTLPPQEDLPSFLRPPQSPGTGSLFHGSDDETQPYHRVVSAPPGRIGVTFVQYRGHAVVSDVARESPLSGWVFPSDILIAIDEVPVSGMRVRDIVNILTARKERQRALRVISSHAMNEALNTTAVSEVNIGG